MSGLIGLQREADRCASGMGAHPRARSRGSCLARRDRDPANAGAGHDGRSRRARGAGAGPRTSPASPSRCSASKAPTGFASSASGRWPRLPPTPNRPRHPGPVCRGTKKSTPSAGPSGIISSLNARTRDRRNPGAPQPLPRPPTSPRRTPRPIAADEAQDVWDARGAPDVCDAREARDADLRRREAGSEIWPPDPSFCAAEWSGQGEATLFRPRGVRHSA